MPDNTSSGQLDRYTEIGELTQGVRKATKRILFPFAVVVGAEIAYLGFTGRPGALAFAAMGIGTYFTFAVWRNSAIGLPLLPMMAFQAFVIYGIPIVAGHEVILTYPQDFVIKSGIEVLVFNVAMVAGWTGGMRIFHPSPPICHTLHEINESGLKGWSRLGFAMIAAVTIYQVLQGTNALGGVVALLPNGSDSILYALTSVASACGFFLVSLIVGGKEAGATEKAIFWVLLVSNAMISSQDFILSSAAASLITVAIGLFWSRGRVPWRYLTIAMATLSFFNTGKATMRARYWATEDSVGRQIQMTELPGIYVEWAVASYNAMAENTEDSSASKLSGAQVQKNQTLLDRIDNLQNLLFVMDAEQNYHIKPLYGQTYSLIPPLLVPRVFWPNKPRSHEGQILLNVHFGRQDYASTFTTYIAWGLLPEAYGNFGPYLGSTILGLFLGFIFAWIENLTMRKLVVSLEGFLSLGAIMNLMNSYEMVASVLVTSTFQSMMIILAAGTPFVHRMRNAPRPIEED